MSKHGIPTGSPLDQGNEILFHADHELSRHPVHTATQLVSTYIIQTDQPSNTTLRFVRVVKMRLRLLAFILMLGATIAALTDKALMHDITESPVELHWTKTTI